MNDIGLFEAMHTQLSARGYTDEPVTDEQIARIGPPHPAVHRAQALSLAREGALGPLVGGANS